MINQELLKTMAQTASSVGGAIAPTALGSLAAFGIAKTLNDRRKTRLDAESEKIGTMEDPLAGFGPGRLLDFIAGKKSDSADKARFDLQEKAQKQLGITSGTAALLTQSARRVYQVSGELGLKARSVDLLREILGQIVMLSGHMGLDGITKSWRDVYAKSEGFAKSLALNMVSAPSAFLQLPGINELKNLLKSSVSLVKGAVTVVGSVRTGLKKATEWASDFISGGLTGEGISQDKTLQKMGYEKFTGEEKNKSISQSYIANIFPKVLSSIEIESIKQTALQERTLSIFEMAFGIESDRSAIEEIEKSRKSYFDYIKGEMTEDREFLKDIVSAGQKKIVADSNIISRSIVKARTLGLEGEDLDNKLMEMAQGSVFKKAKKQRLNEEIDQQSSLRALNLISEERQKNKEIGGLDFTDYDELYDELFNESKKIFKPQLKRDDDVIKRITGDVREDITKSTGLTRHLGFDAGHFGSQEALFRRTEGATEEQLKIFQDLSSSLKGISVDIGISASGFQRFLDSSDDYDDDLQTSSRSRALPLRISSQQALQLSRQLGLPAGEMLQLNRMNETIDAINREGDLTRRRLTDIIINVTGMSDNILLISDRMQNELDSQINQQILLLTNIDNNIGQISKDAESIGDNLMNLYLDQIGAFELMRQEIKDQRDQTQRLLYDNYKDTESSTLDFDDDSKKKLLIVMSSIVGFVKMMSINPDLIRYMKQFNETGTVKLYEGTKNKPIKPGKVAIVGDKPGAPQTGELIVTGGKTTVVSNREIMDVLEGTEETNIFTTKILSNNIPEHLKVSQDIKKTTDEQTNILETVNKNIQTLTDIDINREARETELAWLKERKVEKTEGKTGGLLDSIGGIIPAIFTLLFGGGLAGAGALATKGIFGAIFGSIGTVISTVFSASAIMTALGAIMKKAGPIGLLISGILGVKDAVFNAEEISGNENVGFFGRIGVGMASMLSSLTFGLLPATTIYKWFASAGESASKELSNFSSKMDSYLTERINSINSFWNDIDFRDLPYVGAIFQHYDRVRDFFFGNKESRDKWTDDYINFNSPQTGVENPAIRERQEAKKRRENDYINLYSPGGQSQAADESLTRREKAEADKQEMIERGRKAQAERDEKRRMKEEAKQISTPVSNMDHMKSFTIDDEAIIARIKEKEGFSAKPYWDVDAHSIGYGHKITPGNEYLKDGVTKEQADKMLREKYPGYKLAAMGIPGFDKMNAQGQAALIDMTYNMGKHWYKSWPTDKKEYFIRSLMDSRYDDASKALLNTKYARQVGNRAKENAEMIAASGKSGTSGASLSPSDVQQAHQQAQSKHTSKQTPNTSSQIDNLNRQAQQERESQYSDTSSNQTDFSTEPVQSQQPQPVVVVNNQQNQQKDKTEDSNSLYIPFVTNMLSTFMNIDDEFLKYKSLNFTGYRQSSVGMVGALA